MSIRVNFRCNYLQAVAMAKKMKDEPLSEQEEACLKTGLGQLERAARRAKDHHEAARG